MCTMAQQQQLQQQKGYTNFVVDLVMLMATRRKPPSVPAFTQKIICTGTQPQTHNIEPNTIDGYYTTL